MTLLGNIKRQTCLKNNNSFTASPRAIHWKAALDILEYIYGTSEYGITFHRGFLSGISLEVFVDADYASKATDRRSVSGGLIMYGGASVC